MIGGSHMISSLQGSSMASPYLLIGECAILLKPLLCGDTIYPVGSVFHVEAAGSIDNNEDKENKDAPI